MKINKAFQTPEMIERQRVSDALGRPESDECKAIIAKAKAHADALEAAAAVRRADMAQQRAEFERTRLQPFLEELAALCNAHRVRLVDVSCVCCGGGEIEVRPLLDGEALDAENVIEGQL